MTPLQRRRLPVLAINLALQHKMGHCELTSELLSAMCGKVISMSGMQQGFQLLLDDMPDIVIDVPKAPEVSVWVSKSFVSLLDYPYSSRSTSVVSSLGPLPTTFCHLSSFSSSRR